MIESRLDRAKGPVATILIKNGTLTVGSEFFADTLKCKVRSLTGDVGPLTRALPSDPVEVLGFTKVPSVGAIVSSTSRPASPAQTSTPAPSPSSEKKLPLIIKADVAGSLEALLKSLPHTNLEVLGTGTGDITESDVLMAVSLKAQILGFNVKVPGPVVKLAETEKIAIKTYRIIYELLEDIDKQILYFAHPELMEETLGTAKIAAIFDINSDRIAGSKVEKGRIALGDRIHIKRGESTIADAKVKSLRKGKDTVAEVKVGDEFGAILAPSVDFAIGDVLVSFKTP